MNRHKIVLLLISLFLSTAAFWGEAADLYVSATGKYVEQGVEHDAYTDLQEAVDAAQSGDTVWVEDGFVCNSDAKSLNSGKRNVRLYASKAMTISSRSGDWRTGAVIQGSYASSYVAGETDDKKCGAGATACFVGYSRTSTILIGFRLEGGATLASSDGYAAGGGAHNATLRNCRIDSCVAYYHGGGANSCVTENCVISNCVAMGSANTYGGGLYAGTHTNALVVDCFCANQGGGVRSTTCYDCVITNCTADSFGGASSSDTLTRCKIYKCYAKSGGSAAYQSKLFDCEVHDCLYQAVQNSSASGTLFVGNEPRSFVFKNADNICSNCVFTANATPVVFADQAASGNRLVDCVLTNNLGTVVSLKSSKGADLEIRRCLISCSDPTKPAILTERYNATSTFNQRFRIYESVINGPVSGTGEIYNTLICDSNATSLNPVDCLETQAMMTGTRDNLKLYNCTVFRNRCLNGSGGVNSDYVEAYNTIICGNQGKDGISDHLFKAVNCCLDETATVSSEGEETNCIRANPDLFVGTSGYLYPSQNSPCCTGGSLTAWALSEMDLAGQPRTSNDGTTVAIGACEFDSSFVGATISCFPENEKAPARGTFTVTYSGLGENLTFAWDFNGDGTVELVTNVASVAYYYPAEGVYHATVTVSDGQKTVSASQEISVLDGYFVSTKNIHAVPGRTGGWGVYTTADGYTHLAYTNLQQAIDAAQSGDIVWVDRDFVCDEGVSFVNGATTKPYRIVIAKNVTVRSESGDWRTGPVIRGSYATDYAESFETRSGADAVGCVAGNAKLGGAKLVGIRLEDGATLADEKAQGGGAYQITLENCLVSSCAAYYQGGGCASVTASDCVISNCSVYGASNTYGAGAYSSDLTRCLVVQNTNLGYYGGGMQGGTAHACTFANNTASFGADISSGTATETLFCGKSLSRTDGNATYQGTVIGCIVSNEAPSRICVYRSKTYDTLFVGNAGVSFEPDAGSFASNCVFRGNSGKCVTLSQTPSSFSVMDCVFTNNTDMCFYVNASRDVRARVLRCQIDSGTATAVTVKPTRESNTYVQAIEMENCTISGRIVGAGNLYNCLIAGGTNATESILAWQKPNAQEDEGLCLYNCTVTANSTPKAATVAGPRVSLVNSIVYGNSPKAGAADTFETADHACITRSAVVETETDCVRQNPRFEVKTPGRAFVPRAGFCRDASVAYDWMTNQDDVRAVDLAGRSRTLDGAADWGAFEMYPQSGFLMTYQ